MSGGRPLLAGLTGGIGSGKSTILALLAEGGCATISADLLARGAVAPGTEGLARVVETFGPDCLAADGSLDRAAMARIVFADDKARRGLEGIIHPLVIEGEEAVIAEWEGRGRPVPLVIESPLLLEIGRQERYDTVILVNCPRKVRLARLKAAGFDPADAEARMDAQWPEEQGTPLVDHVIDNGGSLDHAREQVERLLPFLRGGSGNRAGG